MKNITVQTLLDRAAINAIQIGNGTCIGCSIQAAEGDQAVVRIIGVVRRRLRCHGPVCFRETDPLRMAEHVQRTPAILRGAADDNKITCSVIPMFD